jgi:hypothetical protein
MYHLYCWHNSRLCTVHCTYRTVQGVLMASLRSLSGLSERVSYSECYRLQDMGFGLH